jgi:HSP20 family protein
MFSTMLSNDVRQTLDQFRRSVDRLFDEAYTPKGEATQYGQEWSFSPIVESAWNENEVLLRAIVPGVAENDVHVNVQGNQLVIQGERRRPESFDKNSWTQLSYGKFQTALSLPNGLNLDHVSCRLHDGVLDIRIPVAESMKPRQVQIQTGDDRKAIGS